MVRFGLVCRFAARRKTFFNSCANDVEKKKNERRFSKNIVKRALQNNRFSQISVHLRIEITQTHFQMADEGLEPPIKRHLNGVQTAFEQLDGQRALLTTFLFNSDKIGDKVQNLRYLCGHESGRFETKSG
jgi:hypothetical protein